MANVIGPNFFQKALKSEKARIRGFYQDIIGWKLNEVNPDMDIFSFSEEATYGIQYTDDTQSLLTESEFGKSTWLAIKAEDRAELVAKIKEFGVTELAEMSDDNNFFFHAPGGQVYAL